MKIGGLPSPQPAPREKSAGKPLSASICHALAALCFACAGLFVLAALVRAIDDGGFYAVGAAVSGLVWWVIGDVVAGVSRRGPK